MGGRLQSETFGLVVFVIGVLLGLSLGFAFGWGWPKTQVEYEEMRFLDILVATGTIGAALVALFFGLREIIKQRVSQRKKEVFLQEAINNELEELAACLSRFLSYLLVFDQSKVYEDIELKMNIEKTMAELNTPIIEKFGMDLIHLPRDYGAISMEIVGRLHAIKAKVREMINVFESPQQKHFLFDLYLQEVMLEVKAAGIQVCYVRNDENVMAAYKTCFSITD